MKTTKTLYQCPHCEGFNIACDASYRLNDDDYETFDLMSCCDCGYETKAYMLQHIVPTDFDHRIDKLP